MDDKETTTPVPHTPVRRASDTGTDCFGREVFPDGDPEAGRPPAELSEPPPSRRSVRRLISEHRVLVGLFVAALLITAFVVGVLPHITSIGNTVHRLRRGNLLWLLAGVGLETISIAGYILLFRTVFSCEGTRIGWKASYEITLAGVVATKLFAAAGAGGIALTAWALRAAGLSARAVARRLAGFEILLYTVFMLTLLIVGLGLGTGLFGVQAAWTLSYLPALVGAAVIALALTAALLPGAFDRALPWVAARSRRLGGVVRRISTVPTAVRDGLGTATELLRALEPGSLGAIVYWALDIATLYVSFKAFGTSVPVPVVIMGYFVGQLANAIPLPGGIGGVEGGMIGCFIGLNVNGAAAVEAVFAYRAISFWLPTLPGAVAYLQLRRRIAGWRESGEPAQPTRAG